MVVERLEDSISGETGKERIICGQGLRMAPVAGFEPATKGLTVLCATAALHRNKNFSQNRKVSKIYHTCGFVSIIKTLGL
jgi:hypothetical protein